MVRRDLIRRLEALEAPLAGPSSAEIEDYAAFLLMLDSRLGRHRGGIGDTEAERAAMQLLRTATTFEECKAAVEAWEEEQKKRPDYGMTPAEVLSSRHKPLRGEEGAPSSYPRQSAPWDLRGAPSAEGRGGSTVRSSGRSW